MCDDRNSIVRPAFRRFISANRMWADRNPICTREFSIFCTHISIVSSAIRIFCTHISIVADRIPSVTRAFRRFKHE